MIMFVVSRIRFKMRLPVPTKWMITDSEAKQKLHWYVSVSPLRIFYSLSREGGASHSLALHVHYSESESRKCKYVFSTGDF